jgi:hypothetical protein
MNQTRILTSLLLLAVLTGCNQQAARTANVVSDPRTIAWSSLAALPDWSGAWVKDGAQSTIFEDCCVPGKGHARLQPKYQAARDKAAATIVAGKPGGDNLSTCMPDGMPGILLHGVAFEFMNTPGRVTMITENGEVRRIYTDGRAHPPERELYTAMTGHSIGHWESDTLVVDTIGMDTRSMVFLVNAIRVTPQTHIVERMRLKAPDTLQIDTTISDPELFIAPYSYTLTYVRGLREEEFTVGCMQSNRDSGEKTNLVPPEE